MMMQIILTYCIVTQFTSSQCLLRSNFIYLTFLSFTENIFHSANLIVLNFEMCQIMPVSLLCFCLNLTLQAKKCTSFQMRNFNPNIPLHRVVRRRSDKQLKKDEAMKRTGLLWCFFLRKCLDDDDVFKQLLSLVQTMPPKLLHKWQQVFLLYYFQVEERKKNFV